VGIEDVLCTRSVPAAVSLSVRFKHVAIIRCYYLRSLERSAVLTLAYSYQGESEMLDSSWLTL